MNEISQTSTILKMLKDAGEFGVNNYDFINRRITRFSARILELRADGHDILTERVKLPTGRYTNVYRYTLLKGDDE